MAVDGGYEGFGEEKGLRACRYGGGRYPVKCVDIDGIACKVWSRAERSTHNILNVTEFAPYWNQ